MTEADTLLSRAINDPALSPQEIVWIFIKLSGEYPLEIESMWMLLNQEMQSLVKNTVQNAPNDPAGWESLQFIAPHRDADLVKRIWRNGIDAIRLQSRLV